VGAYFKNPIFAHSGFTTRIDEDKLPAGTYTIGIEKVIAGKKEHAVIFSSKTIKIGIPDIFTPIPVTGLPPAGDFGQ